MNAPWDWTEDDLLRLIADKVEENVELDYKSCDSLQKTDGKKADISKDVSAFANSAGGTLIYGVKEDKHVPTELDVGYDPKDITKEWLEQVINSSIQRRIDGIRIRPVPLTRSRPGKVAYVVSAPQSPRAPHMASDHRYYKRFNFESRPMEDYEVRDVSRRFEAPDLTISLQQPHGQGPLQFAAGDGDLSQPVQFTGSIQNLSIEPAHYVFINLFLDARVTPVGRGGMKPQGISVLAIGERQCSVHLLSNNWGVPGKMPIIHDTPFTLFDGPLRLSFPRAARPIAYLMGWQLRAPRMEARERFQIVTVDGTDIQLEPKSLSPDEVVNVPSLVWL